MQMYKLFFKQQNMNLFFQTLNAVLQHIVMQKVFFANIFCSQFKKFMYFCKLNFTAERPPYKA